MTTEKCELCGSDVGLLSCVSMKDGEYVTAYRCSDCRDAVRQLMHEQYAIPKIDWVAHHRQEWREMCEYARKLKSQKELRNW